MNKGELRTRLIPTLLLDGDGLYKTIGFKNRSYIGDPINIVKIFNVKEVDEILILDISVTKEKRDIQWDLLSDIVSECFMPVSYGGGIKDIETISRLNHLGIEKIVLNSVALNDLSFVKEAVNRFGASTICVAINVKRNIFGKYKIYDYVRDTLTKIDLTKFIEVLNEIGVGELLVVDADREGTLKGLDKNIIKFTNNSTDIPVVFSGGLSCVDELRDLVKFELSGIGVGSVFVYQGPHRAVLVSYPTEDELFKILN